MYGLRYLVFGLALVAGSLFVSTAHAQLIDISDCRLEKFKVTAYYSPEQTQSFYYRGNYEDEIILNGRGTHGASGRPVFNGMIAAPQSYEFGTQLFFPGYGIGQVEDRGGAIVHKGERGEKFDRIDLWMGAGEEGLKRALSFGVKYLDAYVCEDNKGDRVGFDYSKFPIHNNFFTKSLWIMQLEQGRTDPWVTTLQNFLAQLNYHPDTKVTGYFGPITKQSVCEFQQDTIGLDSSSIWCGYFGVQTRNALKSAVRNHGLWAGSSDTSPSASDIQLAAKQDPEEVEATPEPEMPDSSPAPADSSEQSDTTSETAPVEEPALEVDTSSKDMPLSKEMNAYYLRIGDSRKYQFLSPIRMGDEGKEVSLLQRKLQRLGYYTGRVSGRYDTLTAQAVYAFQLANGILAGDEDPRLFGYFGPSTRKAINSY